MWNNSEIPLTFGLDTTLIPKKDLIEFSHYESTLPFSQHTLSGFSNTRLQVTIRPTSAGDMNFVVRLNNHNDPSNSICIKISTVTTVSVLLNSDCTLTTRIDAPVVQPIAKC